VDLAEGGVIELDNPRSASLWKAHGFMAAIAWAVFSPMAIGAALIRKLLPRDGLWFQIHRTLNSLTVIFTMIAVIIAIVAINQETPDGADSNHFNPDFSDGHRTIGLVVFIVALFQAIGGLLRPHVPEKKEPDEEGGEQAPEEKSGARKAWEIGHRVLGLALLALCWYQVQLGIKTYNFIWDNGENDKSALKAFWIVVGTLAVGSIGGNLIGRNMESSTDSTDKKESTKRTDE
jgi:hypothetical protein